MIPVITQQQGEEHQTVPAVFCSFSSEGTRRILQAREQECVKCTLTSQPGLEVSGKKTIKRAVQGACKRELAPGVCAQAKNRVSREDLFPVLQDGQDSNFLKASFPLLGGSV